MNENIRAPSKTQEDVINPPALLPKRWLLGKKLYKRSPLQLHNEAIQVEYHHILFKVKKLLASDKPIIFERDYRFDNTENSFALHAFLSPIFYFYIECDFTYFYQVEYAFNDCKHETEIRKLLDTYTLHGRAKEIQLKPDFNIFYANVMAYQNHKYVYVLEA